MKRITNVDTHVGKKLKLRRVALGISQEELGNILGIAFQQVQKYEKGINRVSSGRLYCISKALNVPVNYFFEGIEDESLDSDNSYKQINYDELNKEILVISRLLNEINDKEKKRNLVDTIKNLIKFMK
jgi:transcriptional regulator with XRE-family HTH domain